MAMSPEVALDYINAAKSATYSIATQYSGGEDQGAFKVVNGDGTAAVLKTSKNPMWRPQVERAKAATDHLLPLGYPVPKYLYIDSTNEGTFWLESVLPGQGIATPTDGQITELLRLIEIQRGQAISEVQGQDWSWYAAGVVFRGDSGLVRTLMQFSTETSALAAQIEGLVLGLDSFALGNADLVHGDLGITQVLGENNQISGVLDWDQVGYGDRVMDLIGLWYSLMEMPPARDQVMAAALKAANPQSIKIFAAYKMLASIAWVINRSGGDVPTNAQRAKTALQVLSGI
jgi:aminoglycoside phosphotransferase